MKMSRTAIKELTAAYRAVLKHAFIAAMGAMVVIGGASADDTKTRLVVDADATENLAGVQFTNNKTDENGGAIFNSGTLTLGDGVSFTGNSANFGGAVWNDGKMEIAPGTKFVGNNSKKAAGALYNSGTGTLGNLIGVVFENNTAAQGGAINNSKTLPSVKGGTINLISKSHFIGNSAGISQGGAIRNQGTISTITDSVFDSNVAGNGGAINNGTWGSVVEGIYKTKFINNTAVVGPAQQGGAIVNAGHIGIIDGAVFESNRAGKIGGAIANVTPQNNGNGLAEVNIANSTFTGNVAGESGGAIYNATGGAVTLSGKNTFTGNTAGKNGGAIFNEGAKDKIGNASGVMTIRDSVFGENSAEAWGGAIFNDGTMTLGDGVSFTGNSANFGGAVWNQGTLKAEAGTKFIGNKATFAGGALYNEDNTTIDSLAGIMFENNSARQGGAINNAWRNKDKGTLAAKIESISQSRFVNNSAIQSEGGAIRNQGIIGEIKGTVFDSNIAGEGGALWNGSLGQVGVIDDVDFINNKATLKNLTGELGQGGAIANRNKTDDDKIAITIKGSRFVGNQAAALGGAIANMKPNGDKAGTVKMQITDATFTGNTAGEFGGAIYNYEDAETTLSGKNTFTGNMAGDVGNDIHNLGKLTVSDGTTTIDGGITGDGALTIADGATLNIGTTTVQQKELTLDGTVGATIVGANNYGKLLAETYKGNGKVSLNVATTGTYNIFGENANEYTVVDAGAIYDVTKGDNGAITIATKKVEEIAKETGLTDTAANTVAALANVDNDLANIASLNAQQALRNGDTDYVEIESAKANPVDKPVVQSVAQSVQGAVMTLAANRMAGAPSAGTMGRSGGDLSDADYGVWAQGMFNKSKFNGQFNGYTRGVSAGFDALIDKQYTIGLGYAFGHSDVHANGGRDTEIDSNSIFAYAQYKPSEWFVNVALNYTMSKYTETVDAFGVRLKSDYDTDAFGGQVMTGYDFASGLTPEVGLRYLHVTQDSYNNGLNHVSSDDTDFLTGIAGMKYRFAIENDSVINWFPELRAAATYDFVSDKAMSTVTMPGAASYVVDGDRLSRFGGEFGIGLTAEYNGLEISLVYDLNLHKDYTSQTGMAKFRYEF